MLDDLTGRTLLGRFRVEAYLASGAMGSVYRVYDLEFNAPVAIKVLHPDYLERPEILAQFAQEAKVLEALAHPNIVNFYGFYQTQDLAFLALRFINGPTLKAILKQRQGRPLLLDETLHYLTPVGSALAFAHNNDVIHCDLKPGNIILDSGGKVYLTDFSISRRSGSRRGYMSTAGTPAYMAPEQIEGAAPLPQTDIYSMGVILFEMLTGQRPFHGASFGSGTTTQRIQWEHVHQPPPRPHRLNPAISLPLEEVILRCLEKDPRSRYLNVTETLQALSSVSAVRPPDAHCKPDQPQPPWPKPPVNHPSKPSPPARQPRTPIWLFLGMGAVVLLILFFSFQSAGAPGLMLPTLRPTSAETEAPPAEIPPTRIVIPIPEQVVTTPQAAVHLPVQACMIIHLDASNNLEECVTGLTRQTNGQLKIDFTWRVSLQSEVELVVGSDAANPGMYLSDDLGNRYPHLQTGGAASQITILTGKQSARGWFLFPPPASGARWIRFHDDDNGVQTSTINLP